MHGQKFLTTADIFGPVFQNARNPVLVKDRASTFVHVNKAACRLLGAAGDVLVGKTDFDLLPHSEAERIIKMDDEVFRSGEERLFEEEITGPDGRARLLMTHKYRVDLPDREPVLVACLSDITELRKAERDLQASQEHHRSLMELHPQVPWVAGPDGALIEVGSLWQKICGQSIDEALKFGWLAAVHPSDLPRLMRSWKKSIKTGFPFDVECRLKIANGSYRWFRSRAGAKAGVSSEIEAWYGLLEDVHERRLAIDALQRSRHELRQHRDALEEIVQQRTAEVERKSTELNRLLQQEREVNALQRRFVSMISHEFRTPLTIIDAAAQRLSRSQVELTPERIAEKTRQIKGAVSRMVELMESILAAGRLQSGTIIVRKAVCSLRQLIEDCIARRTEINTDHTFHADLSALPEFIFADKDALERVFINLLSNAVKYSAGKPDIRIRGWMEDGWVKVTVSDDGIGMDVEDLPNLFQPYFRARSAAGIAGTGIGLNIAQEIVSLHDGTISADSRLGVGTTFTVRLPAATTTSDATDAAA